MRLLLTAMLGALGFSAAAAPGAISGDNVNMRRAPARTAEVVMKLNRDLPVEILSTENGWVKIGIRDAYVHTDYLKDGKVAAKTNLRVGPGTETARLGALSDARECQELGRQGKWAHVRFREPVVEGYVSESLVKAGAAPAAATTKPDTPPAAASTTKPATPAATTKPAVKPGQREIVAEPANDNWYGKLPIDLASRRDVTVSGVLHPFQQADLPGFRFALLEVKNGQYVVSCYVYTGTDKKYDAYAGKQVKLVGDWYKVNGWSRPVMKLRKLSPRE